MNNAKHYIESIINSGRFAGVDAELAFMEIISGTWSDTQIAGFLCALGAMGETPEILAAGARVLRSHLTPVLAPDGAIDTCGTGGDAKGSFNISTASAIIAAGAGIPVAKHGNKALSSKSGSSEVLHELGVNLQLSPVGVSSCMKQANIGFMFAPLHHSAMKHVAAARKNLGVRTIFNLLGPLCNPAGTKRQLLGVYAEKWTRPMAMVLEELGAECAWVVCGEDGMDEITTTCATSVTEYRGGSLRTFKLHPSEFGISVASMDDLKGGGPRENAQAITRLLDGKRGAFRDICLLNAGAAIYVGGNANNYPDAIAMAASAIDQGHAKATLRKLVETSNSHDIS